MTIEDESTYAIREKRPPKGTVWIVLGALLLAFGAIHLVTIPMFLASGGEGAGLAGKIFGIAIGFGLGILSLLKGLNQRKKYLHN